MDFEENRKIDNTIAIVAHITIIGWIVAVIINVNKTDRDKLFGAFYLRQMLGLIFLGLIGGLAVRILEQIMYIIPVLGPIVYWVSMLAVYITLVIFWVISLVSAFNSEKKEIPLVGRSIQRIFAKAFE